MIEQQTHHQYLKKFKTQESISENSPRFSVTQLERNHKDHKFIRSNQKLDFYESGFLKQDALSYHSQLSLKNQIKNRQVLETLRAIRKQINTLVLSQQKNSISLGQQSRLKSSSHTLNQPQNVTIEQENLMINLADSKRENLEEILTIKDQEIKKLISELNSIEKTLELKEEESIKNLVQIKNQYTQIISTLKAEIEKKNEESDYQYHYISILKNQINKIQNEEQKVMITNEKIQQAEISEQKDNPTQNIQQSLELIKIKNIPFDIVQQKEENTSREDKSKKENLDTSRSNISNNVSLKKNDSFGLEQQVNGLLRALDDLRTQLQNKQEIISTHVIQIQKLRQQNQNLKSGNESQIIQIQNLMVKVSQQNETISSIIQELNFHKTLMAKNMKLLQVDSGINYEDLLKSQISQNQQMQTNLEKIRLQNQNLSTLYTNLRSQYDNLNTEYGIEKLKYMSQKNNTKINYEIQIQNHKNQVSLEKRTADGYLQKLKALKEQINNKDNFIKNQIINKKIVDKNSVQDFFKAYAFEFDIDNLKNKMQTEYAKLIQLQQENALLKLALNNLKSNTVTLHQDN